MVDTDQRVVDEIIHEGEALGTRELIDILERYHDDEPGISEAAIDAYTRELQAREDSSFDDEAFREVLADRRTDADSLVTDGTHLYELDGDRISQYPATWHDELGGERDPTAYLRFFEERVPSMLIQGREDRQGLNEDTLIDVMTVVGEMDRESARAAIESARDDGRVVEDADQHPKAGVYLAND